MNAKSDMSGDEFKEYLLNLIVPLYLHAKDVKSKHVLFKVDG